MFKDFLVIDNFFNEPDKILDFANSLEYFSPTENDYWVGKRSNALYKLDIDMFNAITNRIVNSMFEIGLKDTAYTYAYHMNGYFQRMFENNQSQDNWWHTDQHMFAGVVYLTKDAPKESGTSLIIDNKVHEVENVFNRMVVYRSSIRHKASSGFGNENTKHRITLPFGINSLTVSYVP